MLDYCYIEDLVSKTKNNHKNSKELLINEFTPFIINYSKKIFIDSYDITDIQNESFKILLKCINSYDLSQKSFVSYAINSIKKHLYYLIRISKTNKSFNGPQSLILDTCLENTLPSETPSLYDSFIFKNDYILLCNAVKSLSKVEKDLLICIYYNKKTIHHYAITHNLTYYESSTLHKNILKKLFSIINS